MKNIQPFLRLVLVVVLFATTLVTTRASAVVFTSNTGIGPGVTTYDGAPIIISNCTVTVDGLHNFASVLVGAGGILTHSSATNAILVSTVFNVTNEPQVLSSTNFATLLNTNVISALAVTDLTQTSNYVFGVDYLIATNIANGLQLGRTATSSIPDGATVLVSYSWNSTLSVGLNLAVAGNFTVASGGAIMANGLGYGPGFGAGGGSSSTGTFYDGSGAGHGGQGGISSSFIAGGNGYDSLYQPTQPGSGGGASYAGAGGSGGGLIQIVAGGTVDIEGTLSANGVDAMNSRAGGGSGGGISIITTNMLGGGIITANGGAGEAGHGGGGGGGMIAIQCAANTFSGTLTAFGGTGYFSGGAGTVFIQTAGQNGLLRMDNNGRGGTTSFITLPSLVDMVISNNAGVQAISPFNVGSLTISTNGSLLGQFGIRLTVAATNLTVQAGGVLAVDTQGYAAGIGPGAGTAYIIGNTFYPGGGGGYGGTGGAGSITNAAGGLTYDVQATPTFYGSGGGGYSSSLGGAGGGAVQLLVSGNLQLDGKISANGGVALSGAGGGGSGGSISISCQSLAGTGIISANGGSALPLGGGGGGGGGRILVSAGNNTFTGNITAYGGGGGGGTNWGGAGTIYLQPASGTPQLILDNGGNTGGNTLLQSASAANLMVQNGALGSATSGMNFASLLVASNGWLTALTHSTSESFYISGNATFQAGGGFFADSDGNATGSGGGSGYSSFVFPYGGGGGGYGGRGGNSASNSVPGGYLGNNTTYRPYGAGFGGGGYSPFSVGGYGGGFVQLTVSGTLLLNGLITANGGNGSGLGGGGGSGGAVFLDVGTFTGGGTITANGGTGANATGGGGGGGCIGIIMDNGNFTGNISAYGGNGANWGGAGTIYTKTNSAVNGQLIVDNAGHVGADTPYQSSATTDLTLRNGGSSILTSSVLFDNLVVASNAWLFITNSVVFVTASNVTVQTGGVIFADGFGSAGGVGTGRGLGSGLSPNYPCSGGAHGGFGANSSSNLVFGGTYYDTPSAPTIAGSGGGSFLPYSTGGAGGGLIHMSLTGTLQVNGLLSANGAAGTGVGGGGGSGGAINVSCLSLTGTGTIAANGGNGVGNNGGGGSGGIIEFTFTTNTFGGSYSCAGGGGAAYGGAGPLYFRTNNTSQTELIVDNGGHLGTNTPVSSVTYLVIRNGGTAFVSASPISVINLLISSNAWLMGGSSAVGGSGTVNLAVAGNAMVQAGGGIITDALGNTANAGSGRGNSSTVSLPFQCSGGGHGGYGAMGYNNTPAGGTTYDTTTAPISLGSGGGSSQPDSIGGNGGGYVNLHVSSILQLDGLISANGGNGSGSGGGGGSGGSIQLFTGIFNGTGSITANGGNGANAYGGGGGGGRIAITDTAQNFTGKMTAYGGGGGAYGGAGTIYSKLNSLNSGQVLLDNGGNAGTNTTFDPITANVIIQGGAIGFLPTVNSWAAQTLLIHTNGTLVQPVGGSQRSISASTITIDAGGVFSLNGAGALAQSGTGAGGFTVSVRGGGGHGGYGGGNPSGGGGAYDSIQTPVLAGSGGGSFNSILLDNGGNGGGLMNITVNGTMTVNGRLSANGNAGGYNSGGGAGGSLNLASITTLAGNGLIAANGGAGNGQAGGGGGGRIALLCTTNLFNGGFSAYGGAGSPPGGAGTIYTSIIGTNTLLVSNGGLTGASTPLGSAFSLPTSLFDLNISGGASVVPLSPLPVLKDLNLATGSILTVPGTQSNLVLAVQNNANLAGSVTVDTFGWPQGNGPGVGASTSSKGGGGGYGGAGGASSSGATGGLTNGSALQPVAFGSGGGVGANTTTGGSEGGGAIRLSVAGILTVSGNLSANGDLGLQDDSGGGSGGSIWITANSFTGGGTIAATGGSGALAGGGGGGGGRISIYAPSNLFTGITNVNGGGGYTVGQPGTVNFSSAPLVFQVAAQSPSGTVSNVVSSVTLTFNEVLNPASVSAATFTVTTPNGVLPGSSLTATLSGLSTVQISFPQQNVPGSYAIQAATTITNFFGAALAQNYSGSFIISLPTLSGTVTTTNGAPVAGVLLQPNGGLTGVTTDSNGNYSIGVPVGWSGTVTPSSGTSMFIPGTLSYTNLPAAIGGQNFIMISTIAPGLTTSVNSGNLSLGWNGFNGVTYQAWISTNLVNWTVYGSAIPGTNGPQQISLPLDNSPSVFFRLGASD